MVLTVADNVRILFTWCAFLNIVIPENMARESEKKGKKRIVMMETVIGNVAAVLT